MAITNVMILDRIQAKTEGTRGTLETTNTRWLYPIHGGLTWTHEISTDDVKEASRTFFATDNQTMGIPISRINFEGVVTYEELPWYLTMALEGATLTGNSLGGAPVAYSYEFDPPGTSDDLKSFSCVLGDGTNNYEFKRCMVNKATFRFNPQSGGESYWHMALEIWAQFNSASASLDALADTTRTKVLSKGTKLYSEAAGGTLGTTQVTGKLRSGSITIDNQFEEKIYAENTTAVADDVARGEQICTAELVYEFAADTEFGYFRTPSRRAMRIQQTGATISGANPYTMRWELPYAHIVSFVPGYAGHNKIATIGIVCENNANGSIVTPLECYIINASSTITA